jgi:LysR family transcriptional regulator for metE and metH
MSNDVRSPLRLEVRDLRLVATVATQGSLTLASDVLHVSQPALSRHLGQLEARLATPLFTRTGSRMVPTATGELFLRHAATVLEHVDAAESALASVDARDRRVVRVGTECYTGYHWLPGVSTRFAQLHPGVDIEIAFDAAGDPLPMLRGGLLDVALLTEYRTRRGLALTKLFSDDLVAIVSPHHAWANRPFLLPKDFATVRVLLLSSPGTSYFINRFLTPAGVTAAHVADVQLVGAMASLVEADFGVGVLPGWTIAPEVRAGRLVPLRLGRRGMTRTWSAAVQNAQKNERPIRDFIATLSTFVPASGFRPSSGAGG